MEQGRILTEDCGKIASKSDQYVRVGAVEKYQTYLEKEICLVPRNRICLGPAEPVKSYSFSLLKNKNKNKKRKKKQKTN